MRIQFLDGLRGLFAVLVILYHYDLIFFQISPMDTYNHFIGVCGFFIINGFVLSYKYWKNKSSEYLTSVALRRYFRLTVLPLASILIVYFLMKFNFYFLHDLAKVIFIPDWVTRFYNFPPSLSDALLEVFWGMYFSYDQTFSYNPVLWTMQYSLKGSFFVVSFLALFGRIKNITPLYLIFAVLTILINVVYFAFLFGMWLSDNLFRNPTEPKRGVFGNVFMIGLFIVGIFFALYSNGTAITFYDKINFSVFEKLKISHVIFYHIAGTALIVFSLLRSEVLQKIFSAKVFTTLGSYSFSMYVLHIPILFSVGAFTFLKVSSSGLNYLQCVALSSVVALSVTAAAVYILYNFVDLPAGKFAKRVDKFFLRDG